MQTLQPELVYCFYQIIVNHTFLVGFSCIVSMCGLCLDILTAVSLKYYLAPTVL